LLRLGAYEPEVQSFVAQAEYWQDPFHLSEYLNQSVFLADINNQREAKNQTYKEKLTSLANFVMVMFTQDTMVAPKESEWFGFYAPNQDQTIIPLNQSQLYIEDWLGLKQMDQKNALHFLSSDSNHLQFSDEWFIQNIFPFLNNTI